MSENYDKFQGTFLNNKLDIINDDGSIEENEVIDFNNTDVDALEAYTESQEFQLFKNWVNSVTNTETQQFYEKPPDLREILDEHGSVEEYKSSLLKKPIENYDKFQGTFLNNKLAIINDDGSIEENEVIDFNNTDVDALEAYTESQEFQLFKNWVNSVTNPKTLQFYEKPPDPSSFVKEPELEKQVEAAPEAVVGGPVEAGAEVLKGDKETPKSTSKLKGLVDRAVPLEKKKLKMFTELETLLKIEFTKMEDLVTMLNDFLQKYKGEFSETHPEDALLELIKEELKRDTSKYLTSLAGILEKSLEETLELVMKILRKEEIEGIEGLLDKLPQTPSVDTPLDALVASGASGGPSSSSALSADTVDDAEVVDAEGRKELLAALVSIINGEGSLDDKLIELLEKLRIKIEIRAELVEKLKGLIQSGEREALQELLQEVPELAGGLDLSDLLEALLNQKADSSASGASLSDGESDKPLLSKVLSKQSSSGDSLDVDSLGEGTPGAGQVEVSLETDSSDSVSVQDKKGSTSKKVDIKLTGLGPGQQPSIEGEEDADSSENLSVIQHFSDRYEAGSKIRELELQIAELKDKSTGEGVDAFEANLKIKQLTEQVEILKANRDERKSALREAQLLVLKEKSKLDKGVDAEAAFLTTLVSQTGKAMNEIDAETKGVDAEVSEARQQLHDIINKQDEMATASAILESGKAQKTEKRQEEIESELFKTELETEFFLGDEFIKELKDVESGINTEYKTKIPGKETSMPYEDIKEKLGYTLKDPELYTLTREEVGKELAPEIASTSIETGVGKAMQQGGAGGGILNEIETKFNTQKQYADQLSGKIELIKSKLKEISKKHEPGEDGTGTLIPTEEHAIGRQKLTDYYSNSRDYHSSYALPLVYTKFINVFIFYISYFNKFKNSFLVKKLENLKNSEIYKGPRRGDILADFKPIIKQIAAVDFADIEHFFSYHFNLKSTNFSYFPGLITKILIEKSDTGHESSYHNFKMTNEEFKKGLEELLEKISDLTTGEQMKDLRIDNLNDILFYYTSTRFTKINSALRTQGNSDKFFYVPDRKILGFMYFSILRLSQYYKTQYEKNIEKLLNDSALYEKLSNFFNKYNESSVISYIKIRDGANEEEKKYQLFNPRYVYYSDIDYKTAEDIRGGLSLGLKDDSPSATLSLFYCNDPSTPLKIPDYQDEWEKKRPTPNDTVITALDYDELDNPITNLFPRYDHLFHYGHFNKVLYNENNEKFGNKMTEVITKLEKLQDVFIIGYGASGAGKTTTLIYDKNELKEGRSGNPDGAVVFMLNQLAKKSMEEPKEGRDFTEIKLTICELFMAKPEVGVEEIDPNTIYPTVIRKISDADFKFGKDSFISQNLTFEKYTSKNITANNNNNYQVHEEYGELFMKQASDAEEYARINNENKEDFPPGEEAAAQFTLSKILQLLIDKKRKVSGTTNNPQSSRSHVLSIISFPKVIKDGGSETVKLYIGDFAGVENKFDYSSFDYGLSSQLEQFSDVILKYIYQIASDATLVTLPRAEDREKFNPAHQLIKDLLNKDKIAELPDKMTNLGNINVLITAIDMLSLGVLFGKTIMDYAFLKHPKEKYEEVYDKDKGVVGAWKALEDDDKNEFDKSNDLVYFYQLLSGKENTDEGLLQKVAEMVPMIKFLGDKKFGYGDKYQVTSKIKTFLTSQPNNGFKFRPPPSGKKSTNQEEYEKQLGENKEDQKQLNKKIDNVEKEYGLIDVYQNSSGTTSIPLEYKTTKLTIPHPGKNLTRSRTNIEKLVQGLGIADNHELGYTFLDLYKDNGSHYFDRSGSEKMMNRNKLFDLICIDTLKDWFKGIEMPDHPKAIPRKEMTHSGKTGKGDAGKDDEPYLTLTASNGRGEEIIFNKAPNNPDKKNGGIIAGNFIKSVEFYVDVEDDFKLKILENSLVPSDYLLSKDNPNNLGLPTAIYNDPKFYNDQDGRNFIINSRDKGADYWLTFAGTRVKEAMTHLEKTKFDVARLIERNFNASYYPKARSTQFAHLGTNPGGVNNYGTSGKEYSLDELQNLIKTQHVEMEKIKTEIRKMTGQQTTKLELEVQKLESRYTELQGLISKEEGDKSHYAEIAEAVTKRIFHVHYEVIKRTYEGLFINKSLEQMRFTMTDVLKATNQKRGESTSLVPNFNSKCTNYYSNVLLEDLFEEDIKLTEDSSDETNRNRFNVIHQIMVQNKGIQPNDQLKQINQQAITSNLSSGLAYCVCLLLNNTYRETQNFSLVNNPPKIPYIDLTEAYTELSRYIARNINVEDEEYKVKNLVFKKYYTSKEKTAGTKNDYLLCESLRKKIEEITGFAYEEFTNKKFNIHIFENLNTYMNYCYSAAIENKTIAKRKKEEIFEKYHDLNLVVRQANTNTVSLDKRGVLAVVKAAKAYLLLIEIMNGTSVIGTIDFADEISKYNLKYNKCSVTQFNINYKSYNQLYSSNYDYLEKFRYKIDTAEQLSLRATGVHAFIPSTNSVVSQVWFNFILPSLLKLSESFSVYNGLIKNKMLPLLLANESGDATNNYGSINKQIVEDSGNLKILPVGSAELQIPLIHEEDDLKLKLTLSNSSADSVELDLTQLSLGTFQEDTIEDEFMSKLKTVTSIDKNEEIQERIKIIKKQRLFIKKQLIALQTGDDTVAGIKQKIATLKIEEKEEIRRVLEIKEKFAQMKDTHPGIPELEQFGKFKVIGKITNEDGVTIPEGTEGTLIDLNLQAEQGEFLIIDFNGKKLKKPIAHQFLKGYDSDGKPIFIPSHPDADPKVIISDDFDKFIDDRELKNKTEQEAVARQAKFSKASAPQPLVGVGPIPVPQQSFASGSGISGARQQKSDVQTPRRPTTNLPRQTAGPGVVRQPLPRGARGRFDGTFVPPPQPAVRHRAVRVNQPFRGNKGGSKTRKNLKLKLMPAKKIERKYKQSLKNKVKVNHSQVNRENLLNEYLNNKTKRHLRLKLKEKKKPVKKYKKSFKK